MERHGHEDLNAVEATPPQLQALRLMEIEDDGPLSAGTIHVGRIPGRMVHAWRVANNLVSKGLARLEGNYLYITEAGRLAIARADVRAGKRRQTTGKTNA